MRFPQEGGFGDCSKFLQNHDFRLFRPQAPENESLPNNKPVTVFSQKGWLVEMAWLSQKRGFEVKIWPKPTFPASKSDQRNSTNQ